MTAPWLFAEGEQVLLAADCWPVMRVTITRRDHDSMGNAIYRVGPLPPPGEPSVCYELILFSLRGIDRPAHAFSSNRGRA